MNIATNSDNAINGNGKLWQVVADVKNEDKRQVVAGSGKLIIVIYYVTKIKNNSYVVEAL